MVSLSVWTAAALVVVVAAAVVARLVQRHRFNTMQLLQQHRLRRMGATALLVIAHPDDECMFFGPTIQALVKDGVAVHVLCLTTGNYEGLGDVRRRELVKSCAVLGVAGGNVHVVDDTDMQDGFKATWDMAKATAAVSARLQQTSADVVVTFDAGGITNHPNHIAAGVASRKAAAAAAKPVRVLQLHTLPTWRNYVGVIEALVGWLLSSPVNSLVVETDLDGMLRNRQAALAHPSQMLWYRHLHIVFSSYMWINYLKG